ncbi:MAG: C40 family peptidase [Acidimicrobiales bacterium]
MVAVTFLAATGVTLAPRASADKLSDLRAQAQALNNKIQTLGRQEDALAQAYDQASLEVQSTDAKVAQAAAAAAAAGANADRARAALRQEAVDSYVRGGAGASVAGNLASANTSLLRAEYVDTLATNRSDAMDQFHQASLQAQSAQANLAAQVAADRRVAQKLVADRQSVANAQQQVEAAQGQVHGAIATEVARIQAEQAAAAAAAAQATALRLQQEQAAASQAQGSFPNNPPPPPGQGASAAVAAALSRVGDPYVWGAAGPNAFDCSGLTMWAWAHAGVSLPHFSGAQYSSTTHIPMSAVQPGDLVFFANPGEHMAMYIGNGQIVEAPYTGANVRVVPLYGQFVLASRP